MRKFRATAVLVAISYIFMRPGINSVAAEEEALSPSARLLLGGLMSSNESERVNSALRLSNYSHPEVVARLIDLIRSDKNDTVKRVALRSLGSIGDEKALPIILDEVYGGSLPVMMEAMSAAVNFSSPDVLKMLMEKADSPNPLVRQRAVAFLGQFPGSDITVILMNKLGDISEGVRIAAVKVLGEKDFPDAVNALIDVFEQDRSEAVREQAAKALGNYSDAASSLRRALSDGNSIIRITAAKSLARLGDSAGLATAVEGIKANDQRIRVAACEIIGLLGAEKNRLFLEQAIQDYDRRVQRAAETALRALDKRLAPDDVQKN